MRARFKKVWCEACKSMQFVGECPHQHRVARVEAPPAKLVAEVRAKREGYACPQWLQTLIGWMLRKGIAQPIETLNDNAFALAAGDDKPAKKSA